MYVIYIFTFRGIKALKDVNGIRNALCAWKSNFRNPENRRLVTLKQLLSIRTTSTIAYIIVIDCITSFHQNACQNIF